jgi:hypothetical protein
MTLLIVFVSHICRPVFNLTVDGQSEVLPLNDPTAMALGSLRAIVSYSAPMCNSFIDAKGAPALVRILSKSSCALTLAYTLDLIQGLLGNSGRLGRSQELADKLYHAGAWVLVGGSVSCQQNTS